MDSLREKRASLTGLALAGVGMGAGHVLTNLLLRRKFNDPRFLADIYRAGYRHGLEGKQVSDWRTGLFHRIAGPEVPEMYHYARYAGAVDRLRRSLPDVFNQLMTLPPERHQSYITQLSRRIRRQPEIRDLLSAASAGQATSYSAGIGRFIRGLGQLQTDEQARPLQKAIFALKKNMPTAAKAVLLAQKRERSNIPMRLTGRFFAGERPQFMQSLGMAPRAVIPAKPISKGTLSLVKKYLPEAGALALSFSGVLPGVSAHIVPEIVGHVSINAIRNILARTSFGRKSFGRMLSRAMAGKRMPPDWLTDVALSPGVTEFLRSARQVGAIQRAAAPLMPTAQPPAARPATPMRPGWVGGRYIPHSSYLRSRFVPELKA